jgi:hypothetical protein
MEIMDAIRRAFGPKIDPQQLLGIIAIRLEPTDLLEIISRDHLMP